MTDHPPPSGGQRLDSWKDIAAYLRRDVSTVQRWEKREGMPVHRHLHDRLGSVYAFTTELDVWQQQRGQKPATSSTLAPAPPSSRNLRLILGGIAGLLVVAAVLAWSLTRRDSAPSNPLASAQFQHVTDFDGTETAAAISHDGRLVAFLSDRDGVADVWLTQVGTSQFHNLTRGRAGELVNPDVRTLGFSADDALVTYWTRRQSAATPADIDIVGIPVLGGDARVLLEGAAELDWSRDGSRLLYHTAAPGDPMFVTDRSRSSVRRIFTAPAGLHSHFPVWSPDGRSIYFVHGTVPDGMDLWRIDPAGGAPRRVTSHNARVSHPTFLDDGTLLYLATDAAGEGPWIHALDVASSRTQRVSFGVERYTTLAASSDGRRLVATVAHPKRTLWRVPIGDRVAPAASATRIDTPSGTGRSPRTADDFHVYVVTKGDASAIWKLAGGRATELWSAAGRRVVGGPAIAPDGTRIAFAAEEGGRARLYVMKADGTGARVITEGVVPLGTPSWSPDGRRIAVSASIDQAPRLVVVNVDDGKVTRLGADYAAGPMWSPDGTFLVYSGADVGTAFAVRTIGFDGRSREQPRLTLPRGARRIVFLPKRNAIVVLRGDLDRKDFWLVDLDTGEERQLTDFGRGLPVGDFDVARDGSEIVFDREQENADVVLIQR